MIIRLTTAPNNLPWLLNLMHVKMIVPLLAEDPKRGSKITFKNDQTSEYMDVRESVDEIHGKFKDITASHLLSAWFNSMGPH